MSNESDYVAFIDSERIASGRLHEVLPILKQRFDIDPSELALTFATDTGRQVDFDLRGSLYEVLERAIPTRVRGPGRPRLGVVSREVSLLPRHWEWLGSQSSGISGALRRLTESAMKLQPDATRARRVRDALSNFLSAMAGNLPGYEEACRALFAGDLDRFAANIDAWPKDVRQYAAEQAQVIAAVTAAKPQLPTAQRIVTDLYEQVWSQGDYGAIERLVAEHYVIHSDPGDPWEGQTLGHATYRERVDYSRRAFTDLRFSIHEMVGDNDRIAVRWSAAGTQTGDLPGVPATGKRLIFAGQTIYALEKGRLTGHWQVIDRLGFIREARDS
jgi:steroid delta-isomerase-like uncharacterized protein